MDEITEYVLRNANKVMNDVEKQALRAFHMKQKADAARGTRLAKSFADASTDDPEVSVLVRLGFDGFLESVRERIIMEDKDKRYLNYCPRCGALTRTPSAKQCPKCLFSWHEDS